MFVKFFSYVGDDWNEGYSYMALCCYDLKRYDEFLGFLKKACKLNPQEARLVLSHLFPEDMKPDEYYEYMKSKIDNSL
jgi:tetratricopeptide (TPR) repeat protein